MDPQIAFPNPIARTDLPAPRRKWRYIVGGLLFIFALITLFLPQIFSSKLGRSALKMYLEGKYRGTAWIGDIQTSWFGNTTINGFSLLDPEGRSIKFGRLESQAPFRKLLLGHYDLKNATIKDLSIDFVVDYGDGTDFMDRIQAGWMPNQVAPTPAAGKARVLMNLPDLSGNINLVNATLTLTRGQILDKGYRTVFRSAKFYNINGKLQVNSLDEPWTMDIAGNVGGEETGGTFTAVGKLDLGEDGVLNVAKAAADLTIAMRNVPNAATPGAGSLGWVLLSLVPAEDYGQMFGPLIKTLDLHLTVADGKLRFDQFSAVGETIDKKSTSLAGHPTLDLISIPRKLGVDGPTSANIQLTREVGRRLAYAIPFLQDADNGGDLQLQIDELDLPVIGTLRKMNGKGRLTVKNVKLISGQVFPGEAPRELTTQWQSIVGDTTSVVMLNAPEMRFEIQNGRARCEPYTMTLNDQQVWIAGETEVAGGKLNLEARVALPQPMQKDGLGEAIVVPVTGTVEQPKMELANLVAATAPGRIQEFITKNIADLRGRKKESLQQRSVAQVKSITAPFDEMIKATTQPTTKPTTQPVLLVPEIK
jgi:hypothetical protein